MAEQRMLITPFGTGTNPVPGAPTQAERVLTDFIVKVWPFQNVIMGQIKRKVTDFQLRHEWPMRTVNTRNTTATPWALNISELTPITSEPFLLHNTWTCLRFAVIATHVRQLQKSNWTPDIMAEWLEEGTFEIMKGWEFLLTTSSLIEATAPNVIPQMAGLGSNAAGTALDAASSALWGSGITDTASRQSQRNAGGASWSITLAETGLRALRTAGWTPKVIIVGDTNKAIAEGFPHAQQTFDGSAEKMEAHRNVDRVRTRYGWVDIHLALMDYPSQAVITMDPDAVEFVVPEGLGLQMLPIEPQGDHDQTMCKSMGSLRVYPHGTDLLVNTAA